MFGFFYLGFTLWAYLKKTSRTTLVLAVTGTCLGLAFFNGSYFESFGLRAGATALQNIVVFIGLGALLHFLLIYPKPKPIMGKPNIESLLYLPPLIVGFFLAYRGLLTPAATSGLNTLTTVLLGIVVGGYLLLCVIAMVQSYRGASAEERSQGGLNLALIGTVVGLLLRGIIFS